MQLANLPAIEPAKDGVIFPTSDLITKLLEDLSRVVRADYDEFTLVSEAFGAVQYNDAENVRTHTDKTFARYVDVLGQTDAAIIATAIMEFCTNLQRRFQRYNMYQNGHCPFYFQRMVGRDVLMCRVIETPIKDIMDSRLQGSNDKPERGNYHVASLRDRVRRG